MFRFRWAFLATALVAALAAGCVKDDKPKGRSYNQSEVDVLKDLSYIEGQQDLQIKRHGGGN